MLENLIFRTPNPVYSALERSAALDTHIPIFRASGCRILRPNSNDQCQYYFFFIVSFFPLLGFCPFEPPLLGLFRKGDCLSHLWGLCATPYHSPLTMIQRDLFIYLFIWREKGR